MAAAAVEPIILGIGSLIAAFKLAKMPDFNAIRFNEKEIEETEMKKDLSMEIWSETRKELG